MWPDVVNGSLEFVGALVTWLSVRKIRQDKTVRGVHWLPILFFWVWGLWNMYYYPHLDQWFSFAGGIVLNVVDLIWIMLIIRYWPPDTRPSWWSRRWTS